MALAGIYLMSDLLKSPGSLFSVNIKGDGKRNIPLPKIEISKEHLDSALSQMKAALHEATSKGMNDEGRKDLRIALDGPASAIDESVQTAQTLLNFRDAVNGHFQNSLEKTARTMNEYRLKLLKAVNEAAQKVGIPLTQFDRNIKDDLKTEIRIK